MLFRPCVAKFFDQSLNINVQNKISSYYNYNDTTLNKKVSNQNIRKKITWKRVELAILKSRGRTELQSFIS